MGTVVYRYIFHLGLIGAYLALFRWIKNKKKHHSFTVFRR